MKKFIETNEDFDFCVGFTIYTPTGFRTMYRHFNDLETAKLFASNNDLKNNCKIYVDLDYYNKQFSDTISKKLIKQYENDLYRSYDYDMGVSKDFIYLLEDEKIISREEE